MKTLTCMLLFTWTLSAQAQHFVILVPGFFNLPTPAGSILPHYFSKTVRQTLINHGLTPIVIDNLDPVGSLQNNGSKLEADLRLLQAQHPDSRFDVIAHSAGGLYLAEALTHSPDLPIDQVVTTATPYEGVELVDLVKWIPAFAEISAALNLSSLQEFEARAMPRIVSGFRIPSRVRWTALAAAQNICGVFTCTRADHLSWLLSVAWRFTAKSGDGVVAVESAQGLGTGLAFDTWNGYQIPLEHWEVVLDAEWFGALGVLDTKWIDQQQRLVFGRIAESFKSGAMETPRF